MRQWRVVFEKRRGVIARAGLNGIAAVAAVAAAIAVSTTASSVITESATRGPSHWPTAQAPTASYLSNGVGRALSTSPPAWDPDVVAAIAALGASTNSRALILSRGEDVVVDLTPHGRQAFPVASISKTLVALAVARAADVGALDFDDTVADTVVEWQKDDRRDVRLRDILSHTSGLNAALTSISDPGVPSYHLYAYDVVPDVVSAATSVDFTRFFDEQVLRPAGGDGVIWARDDDGRVLAGAGASVSPQDLVVIGRLLLRGGFTSHGHEVIRARTLDEMTHPYGAVARGFGLGLWLQHPTDNAPQWDIVEARGGSGHMMTVMPSKQAVLVRIGTPGNDAGVPEALHALLRRL